MSDRTAGFLDGIRVVELANELGEYCGRLLASLGAEVVKIEAPCGELTRTFGPFLDDDPHPDRSLHFWHYNLGKKSIVCDLETEEGRATLTSLVASADVLLETRPRGYLQGIGLGPDALDALNPRLVTARITPFGDDGPWADFEGSDLIHLALGGVMMNCGYDPEPDGTYDLPPIAPQMWQSYHIAGELMVASVIAALTYREDSGLGQHLETSVHECVSKNTETDLPNWIYQRQVHRRQTCRHSMPTASANILAATKDGRWNLPYNTYLPGRSTLWSDMIGVLDSYGMAADLTDERFADPGYRASLAGRERIAEVCVAFVAKYQYEREPWKKGQDVGMPWAPIRRPEENLGDEHWKIRGTFSDVYHPELDRTFTYVSGKWVCEQVRWLTDRRPPLLGEHTEELSHHVWAVTEPDPDVTPTQQDRGGAALTSAHDKPFALADLRVIDLAWLLASAGAGRFFSAHGADVIKVEHSSRYDGMRFGTAFPPVGGKEERDRAAEPIPNPARPGPNSSGSFMEINAGKRGLSLNLKSPRGKEILKQLIADADVVVEGFSAGTMERMGLGYDELKKINPSIIYVQQSGMGDLGSYRDIRSYGPTAQAFSGLSDMSGLPEPFPPAGIGYSYLDWFGAYNVSTAIAAALYRRRRTGLGCHIDASQVEVGLYLSGTAILDHSANARRWQRYGNRSPYFEAAPHGAFRAGGDDRWLAIACFTEEHWAAVSDVLSGGQWAADPRFESLADRVRHQSELEQIVNAATSTWDAFELMDTLQSRGVPAGVCQTAQDRYESDPQLRHLEWLVDLDQSSLGRWPVKELPVRFSRTPSYIGGRPGRSGPDYGEDTNEVLREILGLSDEALDELRSEDVI